MSNTTDATRAMRISLGIGFLMLVIKLGAYVLTGSAAILGDAAESVVHVAAVMFAAFSLGLLHKPADDDHPYGHTKIAFFSAGIEGGLIILAALFIIYESVRRWVLHLPPANVDQGLVLTAVSIVINAALGAYLIRTGKRQGSLILESNGKHVLTDVWTSLGAIVGLGLVALTGWPGWDPLCGLIMAANIIWTGYGLMRQSVGGLMDTADAKLNAVLDAALRLETEKRGLKFHALRHRDAGEMHYVEVHLLFDDDIMLRDAHRIATEIEIAVQASVENPVLITTHLECQGDHDELHQHGEASDPHRFRA
ncbi:cation diffusion facilitator family transporter [Prosthecobacter sp.]|uniref:cation diffusion facilitator family transporter n=1 Tax=Prosthecobacter sp. TaxID=1965333 RepID=UPI001DA70014|nr:cation diffusion facilitator family transporter [Prosthecobacter sp.]MCB1279076.1 cation transporter [Prosthecobacter sp.]